MHVTCKSSDKASYKLSSSPRFKDKIRVLMVTTSFPVGPNRASGIFVKRLADSICDLVELTVLTPSAVSQCQSNAGYQVNCFRYAPYKWQIMAHEPGGVLVALKTHPWLGVILPIFIVVLFLKIMQNGREVDVIHANWSITGIIAGLAGLCIGKPVITTLRGSDVRSIDRSRISKSVIVQLFRLNRMVVTVSEAIASSLTTLWPEKKEKICTISNGVSEELLELRRESRRNCLSISTIGNLIPMKDVATTIRAFQRIEGNLQLRVVGEGIERPALEALSRELGLARRVIFVGSVEPDMIQEELSKTDIFVLSSHSEGRPNVVLEAMAAGCAIVSSDLPGVRELIEDGVNGLFFYPGDVNGLARHMQHLVSSEEDRVALGKSARGKIVELGLTWPKCSDKYVNLYRHVLGVE